MTNKSNTAAEQCPVVRKKIGKTTYIVKLHFSKTSSETMTDKVIRLIKHSAENG